MTKSLTNTMADTVVMEEIASGPLAPLAAANITLENYDGAGRSGLSSVIKLDMDTSEGESLDSKVFRAAIEAGRLRQ